jgi:hypothetical protein
MSYLKTTRVLCILNQERKPLNSYQVSESVITLVHYQNLAL